MIRRKSLHLLAAAASTALLFYGWVWLLTLAMQQMARGLG